VHTFLGISIIFSSTIKIRRKMFFFLSLINILTNILKEPKISYFLKDIFIKKRLADHQNVLFLQKKNFANNRINYLGFSC